MIEKIWITWEIQRRNKSLSKEVGAKLFEITSYKSRFRRYPGQILCTLRIIKENRPLILFVQNPSILLASLAVTIKKLYGIKTVVVDAHNAGLFPVEGRSRILNGLSKYIIRKADITLVTNVKLADHVRDVGGRPLVMPDPLPVFNNAETCALDEKHTKRRATFICTWSEDEPYDELIKAAACFENSMEFFVTGKYPANMAVRILPDNVNLTGYLGDNAYICLLRSSDFIIVLTTRENCLNCGAYESVSLERPLILSDTEALRSYFSKGVVYSQNNATDLRYAIQRMLDNLAQETSDISQLKIELARNWQGCMVPLNECLLTKKNQTSVIGQ